MPKSRPEMSGSYWNVRFKAGEDDRLVRFIATQDPRGVQRGSQAFCNVLGPKSSDVFVWSRHRIPMSWYCRYKNNAHTFNPMVKYNSEPSGTPPFQLPPRPRLPTAPPVVRAAGPRTTTTPTPGSIAALPSGSEDAPALAPRPTVQRELPTNDLALASLRSRLAAEESALRAASSGEGKPHRGELDHPSYPPRAPVLPPGADPSVSYNGSKNAIRKKAHSSSTSGTTTRGVTQPTPTPVLPRSHTKTAADTDSLAGSQATSQGAQPSPAPSPVPPTPSVIPAAPPTNTAAAAPTPLGMAQAHAKVHRKLACTAHRTKIFSVDRAWAVYAQTGSVERAREAIQAEATSHTKPEPGATSVDPDVVATAQAQVHRALARLARQTTLERGAEVVREMEGVARGVEARADGQMDDAHESDGTAKRKKVNDGGEVGAKLVKPRCFLLYPANIATTMALVAWGISYLVQI
ncbi:hypothetical protein FB451DRAFT_1563674 [Mycena latifolia]|nr:hypothetical protein FB451DRAFT_1563674 [Mycena latifolia]